MFGRKNQDLRALNRRQLDGSAKDDMAWLGLRGNVPQRERGGGGGMVGSFEKNPMLWAVIVMLAGIGMFLLVVLVLI